MERDLITLNRRRAGHLGQLTILYKQAEALMLSHDNESHVQKVLTSVVDQFTSYRVIHNQCIGDGGSTAELESDYNRHATSYREFVNRVKEWMNNSTPTPQTTETEQPIDFSDNVSQVSSSSATSVRSAHSARSKRMVAELTKQQLQRKHEFERRQGELKRQAEMCEVNDVIEKAALEESLILDEQYNSCTFQSVPRSDYSRHKHVSLCNDVKNICGVDDIGIRNYSLPTKEPDSNENLKERSCEHNSFISKLVDTLHETLTLPKPQIMYFSGNPLNFGKFITAFELNIASKIKEPNRKLDYLVQHCVGEPAELISDCVMLGELGYNKARELLISRYGKPHVVAQAHINELVNARPIRPNDMKRLQRLSLEMIRAQISLSHLGLETELNNLGNLRAIVRRLPTYIQHKWVERAHYINESGRLVRFDDLATFVDEQFRISNSAFNVEPNNGTYSNRRADSKITTTFFTSQDERANTKEGALEKRKCWCCKGSCEELQNCDLFNSYPISERIEYVYKNRLCKNCLVYNHTAGRCRKGKMCRMEGCKGKHHTLLHEHFVDTSTCSAIDALGSRTHKVCLRILPVRVVHGSRSVVTYALLDAGSDVSLCDGRLVKELQLPEVKKEYTINTISDSKKIQGSEVSLTVCSLDSRESIVIPKAWSVPRLPVSLGGLPQKSDIQSWPHLKHLNLPKVDCSDVRLLIGSDMPEVFWTMEERRGGRKQPYAVRSTLG